MTATMNPTALFQHYIQNFFKFPKEIKNDIVYCQRALKAHIKVHQMVLDVYKTQLNPDPIQKKRIIDELETQIYEINAEQQFLLLRLRRFIDDFYKNVTRKGSTIIPELMNFVISNELVPLINDQTFLIYPISVRLRCTEEKLIEKYFEVKNENPNNYFEILDSDEEEEQQQHKMIAKAKSKSKSSNQGMCSSNFQSSSIPINDNNNKRQVSLLKPMAQRANVNPLIDPSLLANDTFVDASQFVEVMDETSAGNLKGFKTVLPNTTGSSTMKRKLDSNVIYPVSIQESKFVIEKECEDVTVSKNVKMSRLNLRQALKKAHTETLAAKAAANILPNVSQVNAAASTSVLPRSKSATDVLNSKKIDQRTRAARGIAAAAASSGAAMKPIEVISSSGDSTPERSSTPLHPTSSMPSEFVDTRIKPEDFGQEMFLRMFGLFTPEMRLQMQQRRSKRKRRTVQSNERSDYHYGRIEYGSFPPPEDKKKRKAFLLSPEITQLQSKRPKRRSAENESSSRSSSSSPDEKRGCNECLKGGGSFECCTECKGFYHQACHREVDDPITNAIKKESPFDKLKLCPACKRLQVRIKNETEQYQALQTTAKKLEQQMVIEKNRRKSLQQESETFKIQMNTLYNIVKAIKSDPENSSD